ncbi:MAG TPA: hypothetical protein VF503_12195 [Sphingobium sp.]|uniref:hypothetical protein n=1 Tax=Sphingobium sp. TaxID=1912891 RepID=UPI002ED4F1F7
MTQPFGNRAVGDFITDANEVETVLAGEQAAFVVALPDTEISEGSAPKTTSK